MNEATQTDPNRDLLWFKLADAYRSSAAKQTDAQEKTKRLDTAITDYQKAVELKQKAMEAGTSKNPTDAQTLAAYYNNMAEADARPARPTTRSSLMDRRRNSTPRMRLSTTSTWARF